MKLLLDTHAMLWWWTEPDRFSSSTFSLLRASETEILVSSVSAYELAYKHHLGKLRLPASLLAGFVNTVADEQWITLPVSAAHSLLAGQLQSPHRDPFDRLLAAQSILENALLVTVDPAFASIPEVRTLWS
jgi:PIN domain nuclease of toxin-antitoxin system